MAAVSIELISRYERGIAYIDGTKMKVAQIAVEWTRLGYDAEQIQDAHPHLTLAQIYAALSYYYAHEREVEADIARQENIVEQLCTSVGPQTTRAELESRF